MAAAPALVGPEADASRQDHRPRDMSQRPQKTVDGAAWRIVEPLIPERPASSSSRPRAPSIACHAPGRHGEASPSPCGRSRGLDLLGSSPPDGPGKDPRLPSALIESFEAPRRRPILLVWPHVAILYTMISAGIRELKNHLSRYSPADRGRRACRCHGSRPRGRGTGPAGQNCWWSRSFSRIDCGRPGASANRGWKPAGRLANDPLARGHGRHAAEHRP